MIDYLAKLADEPKTFVHGRYNDGFEVHGSELDEYYLIAAKKKFKSIKNKIPTLERLAAEQNVDSIESIDDLVKVLFPHTVYKSYPLSYLEKGQFKKLTKWMNGLTAEDLSTIDASECKSIDEWIDLLEEHTNLTLCHSSGTTGKLSFIPRNKAESREPNLLMRNLIRDWFGDNSGPDMIENPLPLIFPSYKHGYQTMIRTSQSQAELFGMTDENSLYLYDDILSADIASLGGRIRAAEARGELGQLEISPELIAKKDKFIAREVVKKQRTKEFYAEAVERFGGKPVYMCTVWTMLYDAMSEAKSQGYSGIFGEDSVLITGGGNKGVELPEGWKEMIYEVTGFSRAYELYGMSEMTTPFVQCEHGNYHIPPTIIPFVLDPISGEALPRSAKQVGRFAFLDLIPETYWGGFISGDEVALSGYDNVCDCGRKGAYVCGEVRRYSEKEGGDDKINCSGAPEAHDKALEFLINASAQI